MCPPNGGDYSTCDPRRDLVLYVHGNTTAGGNIGLEGAVAAFAKNQAQLSLGDYVVIAVTGGLAPEAGALDASTGRMMGALREAGTFKGNFGVGRMTAAEAQAVGV